MKYLRVVDEAGNQTDYKTEHVPRIGERVLLEFGRGGNPVRPHYFRVKDVMYRLGNEAENQAAILIAEESEAEPWPE